MTSTSPNFFAFDGLTFFPVSIKSKAWSIGT